MAATAAMSPRLGRASYLGDRVRGVPDAGAAAVAVWLRALAQVADGMHAPGSVTLPCERDAAAPPAGA